MINNNGKGLYHIGEQHQLGCSCIIVAEEIGYTHYIHPDCRFDNKFHPPLRNYRYERMPDALVRR